MGPVGAELFRTDRKADGLTDMMKLTVTFRNFANAPTKNHKHRRLRNLDENI
jgi:hypothetical protein